MRPFAILLLLTCLFSCSRPKQEAPTGEFSEAEAKELSNLIQSAPDSAQGNIVEQVALQKPATYTDSIWELADFELMRCENPRKLPSQGKLWSFCEREGNLSIYWVEYVEDNIRFWEKYLLRDGLLVYAEEAEKRTADMADDEATYWNCEYIIKDGVVIDHNSLGMGKTEDVAFDLQDIIPLWKSRQKVFSKLKF
jgi:hypothetical protein